MDKLDDYYDILFDFYKKDYDEYIKQSRLLLEDIKKLKTEAPVDFKPYPRLTDPGFNKKIYSKKEFNMFKEQQPDDKTKTYDEIANSKCMSTDFKLTNNQKFLKNFLSPLTQYNGLLLFHSVGVGKTCTAISISEQYLLNSSSKKVLVILSSNLKDNFKKQIFDITRYNKELNKASLCTGTKYPDMVLDKENLTKESLNKRISKIIKDRYQFMGYKELVEFTKRIRDNIEKTEKRKERHDEKYNQKLKELFSNRLIVVDEAHNLRLPSETGKKQIASVLQDILEVTENTKLLFLSATPMFNNAKEIIYMINLFLTNDKKPQLKTSEIFDKTGKLTEAGRKKLPIILRGYVSYMRGENPYAFPFRLYPDAVESKAKSIIKLKHITLIGSYMSKNQTGLYNIFKKKVNIEEQLENDEDTPPLEEDEDVVSQKKKQRGEEIDGSNDLQNTLQISNIVYPIYTNKSEDEFTYGKKGFEGCFREVNKQYIYSKNTLEEYGEILDQENIIYYAPKIAKILSYIKKSTGIVFVYSQYYYSGIYPLAIALEHMGFQKYSGQNVAKDITVDVDTQKKLRETGNKYIVISKHDILSPNNDLEIQIAKSRENMRGELIKVIIVSKIGTEGLDLKRIREVHILEPWYNLNRTEQIIGRAIRTCSHMDLPKEERNVTVYLHAAVFPNDKQESIDILTYKMAETKQINITEVQKIMKETSIDCNLNIDVLLYKLKTKFDITTSQGKTISYSLGDQDGSYICDYGKCDLKCLKDVSDITSSDIDDSTFDPLYIYDDIQMYKNYIAMLYTDILLLTYDEILELLNKSYNNIDEDVVAYALQEMLDDSNSIIYHKNKKGYLIYRGNHYIFQENKISELKLSIEERNEVPKPTYLNMSKLVLKNEDILPPSQVAEPKVEPKVEPKAKLKPKPKKNKSSEEEVVSVSKLIKQIEDDYNKIKDLVTPIDINISEEVIYDYVVDRIIDLPGVLEYLKSKTNKNTFEESIYNQILNMEIFIKDKNNIPLYYHNPYDSKIYSFNTNKSIGPIEIGKIKKEIDDLKKKLTKSDLENYKGFISYEDNTAKFKVRTSKSVKGFVCQSTSTFKNADVIDAIKGFYPNVKFQMEKKYLCMIYELVLRMQDKLFKRAYQKID